MTPTPPAIIGETVAVHDGDSFTVLSPSGLFKIRLRGVQAPDFAKSSPCVTHRPGYVCDDRLAAASRDNLAWIIGKRIECAPTGRSWKRVEAWCWVEGRDLSCFQISTGGAVRWDAYWPKGRRCDG